MAIKKKATSGPESKLRYSASLVTQGKSRFYTLTVPTEVLAGTCFATTRQEDPLVGFQRVLDQKRAKAIADYIDAGGTIPQSIVLSAQTDADFELVDGGKTVTFNNVEKAFLILDGQHRVWGFHMAKSTLRVPVVIYSGLTKREESRLFIDINTKQRPVPNELLLDIKKLAGYESDTEATLGQLFDVFNSDQLSPLLGMMSSNARTKGKISRVTFNAACKPSLTYFDTLSVLEIYKILSTYIRVFQIAIQKNELDIALIEPNIFKAIVLAFPAITQKVQDKFGKKYGDAEYLKIIHPMLERLNVQKLDKYRSSPKNLAIYFEELLKEKLVI